VLAWLDKVYRFMMLQGWVHGCAGAPPRPRFSVEDKTRSHCWLGTLLIISAQHLTNCRAPVSDAGKLAFRRNALQFLDSLYRSTSYVP